MDNDKIGSTSQNKFHLFFASSPIGLAEEDFSDVKAQLEFLKEQYSASLANIFKEKPEEIAKCAKLLKVSDINQSLLSLFGVSSRDEYVKFTRLRFQHESFLELLLSVDECHACIEQEMEIQISSGGQRFIKTTRSILNNEKGLVRYLVSCVDITELKAAQENLRLALRELRHLKENLEAENTYLQHEIKLDHNFDEIVSSSDAFKIVLEKIQLVAGTDATVLITGESGTGKELIARALHNISKRASRALVKVNCASLPAHLIESELFGHEKGAFTGAVAQRIGRFELAHGGTIFLDEIGEIPLELQSKLLRILQEGEFERLGSSKTIQVDVRIVAATNRDLESSIALKDFRADLFYRLNVFPIQTIPLREHKEDIPILVNHFCKKYGSKLGKKISTVPNAVMYSLSNYHWPGNVRELENVIERAVIISRGPILELGEWLPDKAKNSAQRQPADYALSDSLNTKESLEDIERTHIVKVMQSTQWRVRGKNGAAEILGIKPTTLEARMKKLGIKKPA